MGCRERDDKSQIWVRMLKIVGTSRRKTRKIFCHENTENGKCEMDYRAGHPPR